MDFYRSMRHTRPFLPRVSEECNLCMESVALAQFFFLCTTHSERHTRKKNVPLLSRLWKNFVVNRHHLIHHIDFAEDTGFEPVGPFSRLVFETSTINHSDNPPCLRCKINNFRDNYQFAALFISFCLLISCRVSEVAMRNCARM